MRNRTRMTLIAAPLALLLCLCLARPILTQSVLHGRLSITVANQVGFSLTPSVSSIAPASVIAGETGFTLSVHGSGFADSFSILINSVQRTTIFVDSTQLTTVVDTSEIASAGTLSVTVFDPAPTGGESTPLIFTINNPAPMATTLLPASAAAGGPDLILSVTGNNFVPASVVSFAGVPVVTTFLSPSELTAHISAAQMVSGGIFPVTVTNPAPGGGVSTPLILTVNNPVPVATSLLPASAAAGGPDLILSVTGSNFVPASVVNFADAPVVTNFVSTTELSAQIPASSMVTSGLFPVTVTNPAPGGGVSTPLILTVNNPVPIATSLLPASAPAGGPDVTLSVSGNDFIPTSVVNFAGTPVVTNFLSTTQLSAHIPASSMVTSGLFAVTVTNPTPGGGTSTPPLTLTLNNPIPTLSALSPASKFAGDTAFTLSLTGTNFNASSVVAINGNSRATTFVSTTQLTAQVLASDIAAVGSVAITVANPAPGGGVSNPVNLTVLAVPVPAITSLSPNNLSAGGSGFTLNVNGSNFYGASVVRFNGSNRPTTFVSSTQLTADLAASDIANAGVYPVTVFNPSPGGGLSAANNLTVNPSITSLAPAVVNVGGSGFTLTVSGTGFVSGSKVRWNGTSKSTTFVSFTKLTASISSSDIVAVGIFSVSVLNPSPTNLVSNTSNVTVTPALLNLTPLTSVGGDPDFTLTVTGAGFVNGAVVSWNGANRPTTFISSTKLTAAIAQSDIATVGTFPVRVVNPPPLDFASNALNFQVTEPPPANECPSGNNNMLANTGLINFGPEKSQMWRNDNLWWGAFSDNATGIYFYKQSGSTFIKGELIDTNFVSGVFVAGSPDCLWNGTNLFILIQESTVLARLYKYTYSPGTQNYALIQGFPVSLPLTGAGTNSSGKIGAMSFDQDSTGKLWAAYASGIGGDGKIHVIWSTSADHMTWQTIPFILASGISTSTQETAPIIHFGGNKIGVAWSNQVALEDAFSYHVDGDPETVWSPKEVIDAGLGPLELGGVAENHMSIKAAPDGRLFLAANDDDGKGHLHLYVRSAAGIWGQKTLIVNDLSANPTRAVLLLDTENSEIHVIYKDSSVTGNSRTFITQSYMNNPAFNAPCFFIDTSQSTQSSSNPTTTKQNIDASTDLMVAASTGKKGNSILFNSLDITPNQVSVFALSPSEVTAGESLSDLTLTVTGKLFVKLPLPGSVVRFNGLDRMTTYFNAGRVTASIPGQELVTPGSLPVTMVNPDGAISNTVEFRVTATNPVPVVSTISPTRELQGTAEFTLTVKGTGFRRTSVVQFNGNNRLTTFISDTQLLATIPASDLLVEGPFPITVRNPTPVGGTSATSRLSTFFVQPPCPASSPQTLPGITLFNTVKSQMWYNDGLWWGALSDNVGGIYFYKQSGASLAKGALLDTNLNGRPDVKWNGTNLFVLVYELNTQAKFYKFSYSATTKTYTLISGFPVSLPLIGIGAGTSSSLTGSITIEQDSAGKLWAAYPGTGPGGDGNIRVIWTTSADHKVWDTTGFVLATGASTTAQEVEPMVHFGGNKVGVIWSNQVAGEIAFRYHQDGEQETNWSTKEVLDFGLGNEVGVGSVADNHMSAKAAPDGRIFLVAKDADGVGYLHLYVRNAAGTWSAPILVDPDPLAQVARPNLLLDLRNSELYVLYEDAIAGLMYVNHSSMDVPDFGPACPFVVSKFVSNATSTKQNLDATTGLWAVASTGGASSQLYVNSVPLAQSIGNPLPVLHGAVPASAASGGGPLTITINGSDFINGAVVYFNGMDRATTFISPTQLSASILASDVAGIGTFPVTVMNPRGGLSTPIMFTVNPTIVNLAPANAVRGAAGLTLTVNGIGFLSGAVVNWNGSPRTTTFTGANQLLAQITAADLKSPGTFPITVVNPGGATSSAVGFTVNNPLPVISLLSPASVVAGDPGFILAVHGSNFVSESVIRLGSSDRGTTFVSSGELTTQISAADIAVAGAIPVTVFNPGPGGGTSAPISFVVNNPAPAVANLSPGTVLAGAGAITLIVNGQGFVNGSVVRLGGADRPTTFVNTSQLAAQLAAADVQSGGVFPITVFNPAPGGGSSSPARLTVDNPIPAIISLAPNNRIAAGVAFVITVNGANFVTGSTVRWNGTDRVTTFINSTQLTAEITAADNSTPGGASVTVLNPAPGGGLSNEVLFTTRERTVRIVSSSGSSGSSVTIPIELDARGNENALSFSLSFDASLLGNPEATLGSGATGALLNTDSTEVIQGRYGVVLSLPAGQSFPFGTREVAVIHFTLANVPAEQTTQLAFAGQPVPPAVYDLTAVPLLTEYAPGAVTIALGYEADVAPRPNGNNNGTVSISDWTLIGRFGSGFDIASPGSEFQRADCAPRSSLGNGSITISDWVQAGRYASGLDPVVAAGGPTGATTAPLTENPKSSTPKIESDASPSTIVRLMAADVATGQRRKVSIEVDTTGSENALGFSLTFDPERLSFISAEKSEELNSATLNVNELEIEDGRVGLALALPAGQSFGPGTHTVVTLTFAAAADAGEKMLFGFADQPIAREVVDVNANSMKSVFEDAMAAMNSLKGFFFAEADDPNFKNTRFWERLNLLFAGTPDERRTKRVSHLPLFRR